MPFEKVRPRKVSAIAAEQIIEAIKNDSFPVGSKLPSEFELAEQMGVSRPSIREALSALQAVGLIESKPGSGNYVRKSPSSDEEERAPHLIESEAGCLEVMEAREVLEPSIAAYIARKGSNGHLAKIEGILQEMRVQAQKGNFNSYFEADKSFRLFTLQARYRAERSRSPLFSCLLLFSAPLRLCERHKLFLSPARYAHSWFPGLLRD